MPLREDSRVLRAALTISCPHVPSGCKSMHPSVFIGSVWATGDRSLPGLMVPAVDSHLPRPQSRLGKLPVGPSHPAPDAPVSLLSILECQGLPIVNGQCDPYATVTLAGPCRQVLCVHLRTGRVGKWPAVTMLGLPQKCRRGCALGRGF